MATPVSTAAVAQDGSGKPGFMQVDVNGRLICQPTAGTATPGSPVTGLAIAVNPSGEPIYLNIDSTGALQAL